MKLLRSGGPIQRRNAAASGTGSPSACSACATQRVMPISESIRVPSRSKNSVDNRSSNPLSATAGFQRGHGGQFLAFAELEEGAATGRNVADAVGDAVLVHRRQRVAAAGDGERVRTG